MADSFTYDSAEEDWDLNTLHVLNSQLEAYLKMVGVLVVFGNLSEFLDALVLKCNHSKIQK